MTAFAILMGHKIYTQIFHPFKVSGSSAKGDNYVTAAHSMDFKFVVTYGDESDAVCAGSRWKPGGGINGGSGEEMASKAVGVGEYRGREIRLEEGVVGGLDQVAVTEEFSAEIRV
ncbi:hypothetical protein IEQ34_007504 [Dendrobium chrysotoxum]|uniref:Uncharacterized protein n=1 Tax=Dendrobium chrysotoxum TaxID=161865 RepID=A0AAV7H3P7_DENCH|nr:hypothetical protein IEQ34_007504 [Dendrobium chrysotoxum]